MERSHDMVNGNKYSVYLISLAADYELKTGTFDKRAFVRACENEMMELHIRMRELKELLSTAKNCVAREG